TGVKTYKLHYTVLRAVNFFDGKAEVYWNATGDKWQFDMKQVTARFYPPAGVRLDELKTDSFYGPPGATTNADFRKEENGVAFFTANLNAGEGLTFVVGLPEGSVVPPSLGQT